MQRRLNMENSEWKKIDPLEMTENPFKLIGRDWMLVASANPSGEACGRDYNMMTASWGGVGILWNKPVAFVFVRPQRHTFSFTEANERITLSFFGEEYRNALSFCGKYSGRDRDKAAECALTPVFGGSDSGRDVIFEEARLVMKTRKLYSAPLDGAHALSDAVTSCYPGNDYHTMYICEIEEILAK